MVVARSPDPLGSFVCLGRPLFGELGNSTFSSMVRALSDLLRDSGFPQRTEESESPIQNLKSGWQVVQTGASQQP